MLHRRLHHSLGEDGNSFPSVNLLTVYGFQGNNRNQTIKPQLFHTKPHELPNLSHFTPSSTNMSSLHRLPILTKSRT